jgi:hypothetical protein
MSTPTEERRLHKILDTTHLFRYLDEQAFRYNNRATPKNPLRDGDRFNMAVSNVHGRRLTYKQVTGKDA